MLVDAPASGERRRGVVRLVRIEVVDEQEEAAVRVALVLEPVDGAGGRRRRVPLVRVLGLAPVQEAVVVDVEALRPAEAPGEDEGAHEGRGLPALLVRQLGQRPLRRGERHAVPQHAVRERIETREQGRVARRGRRARGIRAVEHDPVLAERLHGGRRLSLVAVHRAAVASHRIEGDEEHVRRACGPTLVPTARDGRHEDGHGARGPRDRAEPRRRHPIGVRGARTQRSSGCLQVVATRPHRRDAGVAPPKIGGNKTADASGPAQHLAHHVWTAARPPR